MITEISAVNFRQNLGEMLNQVQYRRDSILISKDGKPVAALVDARLFERIRRMQARFDGLAVRLSEAYADVPQADGMAEIAAAVSAVRSSGAAEPELGKRAPKARSRKAVAKATRKTSRKRSA